MCVPPDELVRDLLEYASDLVQSVDIEGRFLYVNERWRQTLGYTPEEVGRLRLFDVIHPDHRAGCGRMFEMLLQGRELPTVETVFVTRDGRSVELDGRVTLSRDAEGRPRFTRGIFRDVSEQRAARRRIEELLRMTRAIIDHAPVGISLYRQDGQCIEANAALAAIVGGPLERVREFNFRKLESWRRHGLLECAEACLADGRNRHLSTAGTTTFGTKVHLDFDFVPVDLADGRHLLLLTADRTADRRREDALVAQQQRLLKLGEVAREIARHVELDRMLRAAIERVCDLTRATTGAIVQLDPETGQAASLHTPGGRPPWLRPDAALSCEGLLGRLARGTPVVTARAEAEPDFAGWPEGHPCIGPMIGLPLQEAERTVALLLLGRGPDDEPFEEADRQVAETIGNLAIVAIRVARQFDELRRLNARLNELATTDALTGVGNRRAFDEALALQHATSRRYGVPYGLVIADVDHFKRYNDRYGHPAGDRVLAQVAGLLRRSLRVMDGLFRYGGEDLVILLPHQRREGVAVAAERLRRCVEQAAIEHAENTAGVVTLSFGAAAYDPADAAMRPAGAAAVLRAADEALYRAKEHGRNRVEVAATISADDPEEERSRRAGG